MDSAPRLLVVEDDAAVREGLSAALSGSGYSVRSEPDGTALSSTVASYRPDLAILDVRLPRGPDGFDLGAWLRAETGIPIVYLTAADALGDRLRGFDVGADDYLVKPFSMAELLARVRAVLRRGGRVTSATFEIRDVLIDEANSLVRRAGEVIELTKTEFDLLCVMAREPGRVFSKVQLLSMVWGFDQYEPNLVEVHMSGMRRKLEAHGPRIVHTERGEGYVVRP